MAHTRPPKAQAENPDSSSAGDQPYQGVSCGINLDPGGRSEDTPPLADLPDRLRGSFMDWKIPYTTPLDASAREKKIKKTKIITKFTPIAYVAWHDKKQYVMYLPQRSGDPCGARGPRAQKRNLPRGRSAVSCLTSPITHSVTSVFEVDILYDCSITLYICKFVEELFQSYRFFPFNPTNSVRNPSMTPRTSCYSISCMSCPTSVPPRREGTWHQCRTKVRRITHWKSVANSCRKGSCRL